MVRNRATANYHLSLIFNQVNSSFDETAKFQHLPEFYRHFTVSQLTLIAFEDFSVPNLTLRPQWFQLSDGAPSRVKVRRNSLTRGMWHGCHICLLVKSGIGIAPVTWFRNSRYGETYKDLVSALTLSPYGQPGEIITLTTEARRRLLDPGAQPLWASNIHMVVGSRPQITCLVDPWDRHYFGLSPSVKW